MVFFNWATMQMAAKIVYYGPGLCGKTSNLSFIYAKTSPKSRGEMVSLETESDRTLFFDLLPIEVGTIGGFKTRLQLYTVPGQVFYNTTRKLVLKGVDGLVFVADSQRPMREANVESFHSLTENLRELGLEMDDLPLVLQYNKRDLKNILTEEELAGDLNPDGHYTSFLASAITGEGIFETLKEITKITLKKLRKRMAAPQPEASPRSARAPSPPSSSQAVSPRPTPPHRSPSIPTPPSQLPTAAPATISAASLALAAEEGVGDDMPVFGPTAAPDAPVPEEQPQTPDEEPGAESVSSPADETPTDLEGPSLETTTDDEPDQPEEHTPAAVEPAAAQPDAEVPALQELPSGDEGPPVLGAEPVTPPTREFDTDSETTSPSLSEVPADEPFEQLAPPMDEPEPEPLEAEAPPSEAEPLEAEVQPTEPEPDEVEVEVEFDTSSGAERTVEPPPLKRVQVPNQMDILSELDDLRRSATESSSTQRRRSSSVQDLDLDTLLTGSDSRTKDLKKRIEKGLNSNIFQKMDCVQLALRIQDSSGNTIHTLDPVSLKVENASSLEKLVLQLTVNLENIR